MIVSIVVVIIPVIVSFVSLSISIMVVPVVPGAWPITSGERKEHCRHGNAGCNDFLHHALLILGINTPANTSTMKTSSLWGTPHKECIYINHIRLFELEIFESAMWYSLLFHQVPHIRAWFRSAPPVRRVCGIPTKRKRGEGCISPIGKRRPPV